MNQAISQSTNQSTLSLRVLDRKTRRRQMSGIQAKKLRTEIKRKTFLCSTEIKSLTPLLFTPLSTLRHSPYPLPSHARPHPFSTFFLFTHPPPHPTHTHHYLPNGLPPPPPRPNPSLFSFPLHSPTPVAKHLKAQNKDRGLIYRVLVNRLCLSGIYHDLYTKKTVRPLGL